VSLADGGPATRTFVAPATTTAQALRFRIVASDGHMQSIAEATVSVRPELAPDDVLLVTNVGTDGTVHVQARMAGATFWDFGDGSPVVSGTDLQHRYTAPGTYNVTAQVTDAKGVTHTEVESIVVEDVALAADSPDATTATHGFSATPFILAGAVLGVVAIGAAAILLVRLRKKTV
jgi:hypothetical protein